MNRPVGPPDPLRATFGPLVELLRQELQAARRPAPGPPPASTAEFARWYLAAVQALEAHVAAADRHAPMSRTEVELMCRVALSAATLGEAISLVGAYCAALAPRAGRIQLARRRGTAVFELDSQRGAVSAASSLVDITGMFAFLQLFQWLVGAPLALEKARIGPVRREDVQPFLRLFGAPVLAGGRHYTLEFPLAGLARPVVRTRGEFAAFFEAWPCGVFERDAHAPAQQVAALLEAAATRGERLPTLEAVAAALGTPPSTLRRRLGHAGSAFRTLRERVLAEQAQRLLARGELGVARVGERLGFSDAAAFRRAFRRWFGTSPATARGGRAAILAPPARRRRSAPP
jgi:AraC-like DNA-binding protein